MTPAVNIAKAKGLVFSIHEYQHEQDASSYGEEAATKLGISPQQVFKTLVASLDGKELIVAVLPVAHKLSLKALAKAAAGKKATMADPVQVERSTGYVLGGVSPLGQKKRLRTFIDDSAQSLKTVFVSAGKRGLEIELAPQDLALTLSAQFATLIET